jgi:hypothetical protein
MASTDACQAALVSGFLPAELREDFGSALYWGVELQA